MTKEVTILFVYLFNFISPLSTNESRSDDTMRSALVCTDGIFAEWIPSVATVFIAKLHAVHLALHQIPAKISSLLQGLWIIQVFVKLLLLQVGVIPRVVPLAAIICFF